MDNKLQVFKNNEFGKIRAVEINGEGWLVGKDIAEILQYKETHKAISRHVDKDDRIKHPVTDNLGRFQNTWIINESGFYSLLLSSEMKEAKGFKRWVTSDILPSIRKHGAYLTDEKIEEVLTDPDTIIKLATQLKEEREEKKLLQQQAEENKPKVSFAEAVEDSEDVILVKEMATILTQRGFNIGQNQLFQYLRDNGYLCKKEGDMYHLPTKKYEHLFKVTKRIIQNSKGTMVKNTPKITGRGQLYFIRKFDKYIGQGLTIKDLLTRDIEGLEKVM